ncbi:sugar ABC transporter substrate-binding protein [Nodosilinea sp. P-1105]|uniref:ABC transporter substrate-binding protein n=1 Tax=Nodosilinea sp. P-1105 TaxID=2546229 RepID=UPI00146A0ECB|nr:sugar ABC transporter substrate-binding protein [Nodosilinea sp. P-1105]NMF85118.1 sugar ABC transporter substrate-binding protein [Nodosilinea sp. P-1105]
MKQGSWTRFGLLTLVGLLLSWLVACGDGQPGPSTQDGRQEIEFWTMQLQPDFTDYFNDLIAEYEAEHPDQSVRWVDVPWGDMQSKILTAVAAGTAPDVVNLNPDFAAQLAGRNAWLPLNDYISDIDQQVYLPNIWQANTLNGQSFGLPWYLTTNIIFYNQDLLGAAEVDPPTTFEELAQVARQVKEATGKYAYFTTFVPEDAADVLQSFVQMGVDLVDDQGQAAFNTPEGQAVFQYWTDLYQQDLLPREVLTQGHRRAIELFQAGEVALLSIGAEFFPTIETNAPDIAQVTRSAPQITGETGKKNVAVMNLVIPAATDIPEAAVDFALFVTNDVNQLAFAQSANVLPSTAAALADDYFEADENAAGGVELARSISASQMNQAEVLIPAMDDINLLQGIVYDNLQAAMLGQKTVEQAIADAAAEWDGR